MCPYVPSYAVAKPTFQPSMRIVIAITNAATALVTTSFAHQYIIGTIIRLDIPFKWGMQQANQAVGTILTIPTTTTFTIDLNTTNFDIFAIPSDLPPSYTDAQVVAIGEINEILTAAEQNVLPYTS